MRQHAVVQQMIGSGEAPPLPAGVDASEIQIPVEGSCGSPDCEACTHGAITAFVYRPTGVTDAPAYLSLHGGGWWLMGGDILRRSGVGDASLALALGVVVVDVDYRLAPEHKFPLPAEDSYAALTWVAGHADELGVDPSRTRSAAAAPVGTSPPRSP